MSTIYRHMKKAIEEKLGVLEFSSELIRKGFERGQVTFRGEKIDFKQFENEAKGKARDSVDKLFSTAGNMDDVARIILVGGGAQFYLDAIKAKLNTQRVELPPRPVYANAYGFWIAGSQ
jgi:hypothetical protein